jgi:hypothetical protein
LRFGIVTPTLTGTRIRQYSAGVLDAMRSVGLVTAFYESGDRHIGSVAGSGGMAASLRGKTPGHNRSSRNFSDKSMSEGTDLNRGGTGTAPA